MLPGAGLEPQRRTRCVCWVDPVVHGAGAGGTPAMDKNRERVTVGEERAALEESRREGLP